MGWPIVPERFMNHLQRGAEALEKIAEHLGNISQILWNNGQSIDAVASAAAPKTHQHTFLEDAFMGMATCPCGAVRRRDGSIYEGPQE